MSIQIKLDAHALRELFPEGSEARVILARSVVEEIVKSLKGKTISSVTADVLAEMKPHLEEIKREMVNHVGTLVTGGHWNKVLTDEAKQMIKNNAKLFIDDQVTNLVLSSVGDYISDKEKVDNRIEHIISQKMALTDQFINHRVNQLILNRVNIALSAIQPVSIDA